MLMKIHEVHMGIVKCRHRAQDSVWWPSITTDLNRIVENCQQCLQMRVQWAKPLQPITLPSRPWAFEGMDIFEAAGVHYLVVQDYFSRFFELVRLKNLTPEGWVLQAKNIFARHGIPETVRSDNRTQFTAQEFQHFAKDYGFDHITSTPKFPQSWEPQWRWPYLQMFLRNVDRIKERSRRNYNAQHGARTLVHLQPRTRVWAPNIHKYGKVLGLTDHPLSYMVETSTWRGRRNRRQLVAVPEEGQA
ncbi:hypothetical protein PR048_005614 [Dryococelus australis]|uniref:RNA-directed DNA polymerase n=1 Tax=Dryococelus australis TaxID=614101 RepID=A0ABQ9IAT7_9NEOP|nr:hypothetical protein PR048_005614 [Dryococelus australis]